MFTYVEYDSELADDDGVTMRYHEIVLLKDYGGGALREGEKFDQVEIDVSSGKIAFGVIVDCPVSPAACCGKTIQFTEAFDIA